MIEALEEKPLELERGTGPRRPAPRLAAVWSVDYHAPSQIQDNHISFDWHSCGLSEEYDALLDRKEELSKVACSPAGAYGADSCMNGHLYPASLSEAELLEQEEWEAARLLRDTLPGVGLQAVLNAAVADDERDSCGRGRTVQEETFQTAEASHAAMGSCEDVSHPDEENHPHETMEIEERSTPSPRKGVGCLDG